MQRAQRNVPVYLRGLQQAEERTQEKLLLLKAQQRDKLCMDQEQVCARACACLCSLAVSECLQDLFVCATETCLCVQCANPNAEPLHWGDLVLLCFVKLSQNFCPVLSYFPSLLPLVSICLWSPIKLRDYSSSWLFNLQSHRQLCDQDFSFTLDATMTLKLPKSLYSHTSQLRSAIRHATIIALGY